ncbi:MAG: hypothetical protein AABW75_02810 [Nanoarchaeota archaeon]
MGSDREDVFDDDLEVEERKRRPFFKHSLFKKWVIKQKRKKLFILLDFFALFAFVISIYFFSQKIYSKGIISLTVTLAIILFFFVREKMRHKRLRVLLR